MAFAASAADWKAGLPRPVYDENPGLAELYLRAWEIAHDHIHELPGLPAPRHMDEGLWDDRVWIWDTCFMVQYCKYLPEEFPGVESLENFYAVMLADGAKPLPRVKCDYASTGRRGETLDFYIHHPDNPPLFAWTEYRYALQTGDRARLEKVYAREKWLQRWYGLFESFDPAAPQPYGSKQRVMLKRVAHGYRWGGCPNGMDNTPRGRTKATAFGAVAACPDNPDLLWIDAYAQQGLSALCIARIAELLGRNDDAAAWRARYETAKKEINERYWDDVDGFYYDILESDGTKVKVMTPASFWPALAEMPSRGQMDRMVRALTDPQTLGGDVATPSLARNDPDFDPKGAYWRGAVWLPTTYMTVKALDAYGDYALARSVSRGVVERMYRTWKNFEPHTVWECYSPTEDKPATEKTGRWSRQDFCGWSALGPISLFIEDVIGVKEANAFANTLTCDFEKRPKGRVGVENYRFGEVVCSVIADEREIRVTSNRPFTLVADGVRRDVAAGENRFARRQGVKLAAPFGDGMVLQRGRKVPVWGTAGPGEKVTVSFAGQTRVSTADATGRWRVDLAPMEASKQGRDLIVVSTSQCPEPNEATGSAGLHDVLVGEVWLAAGQSNMELPLVSENPRFRDRKGAMLAQYVERPYIRIADVSDYKWSPEPRAELRSPISWRKVEPALLQQNRAVSACGLYYALELYGQLDVPIGIVEARWGGTNIDAWTPREGYEGLPELADVAAARIYRSKEEGFRPYLPVWDLHQQPTALWNEMVAPLCPMAARGFIWYQGCHNFGEWQRYGSKMHALYNGWAKKFENPDLKLYFVQLAPWRNEALPKIQQEQARFAAEEPNAEIAIVNDIGNIHDVHPSEKQLVAQRLALHALRRDYGYTAIRDRSPVFKSGYADGAKAVLAFDEAEGFYVYNDDTSVDCGFELAGEDGVFHPAHIDNFKGKDSWVTGVVAGKKAILYADGVTRPWKVRYLHKAPYRGAFYNEANLPLGAFEADLDASAERQAKEREDATAWMAGKVGAFTHYLVGSNDFARVGEFDVEGLVRRLKETKAAYYVLTLGQNTGYYCAPNSAYEKIAGYGRGERCAVRDIPREIIDGLRGSGIRFGLYLPGQPANRDDRAERAFGFAEIGKWNDRKFNRAAAENWAKVIREWSSRYGDGVSLWWFDGCYDHLGFNDEYARLYRDAVRVGNPEAVVAFNEGVRLRSAETESDYWAGEENEPFDLETKSRLRRRGQQWQVLTFLGSTWGEADLRYPVEKWREWVGKVTSKGGAVTLDMNISKPEGRLNDAQVEVFKRITAVPSSCCASAMAGQLRAW